MRTAKNFLDVYRITATFYTLNSLLYIQVRPEAD